MAGQGGGEEVLEGGDTAQVADEHEEGEEGQQQGVVHLPEDGAVGKEQEHQHHRRHRQGRHHGEQPQQAQDKPQAAQGKAFGAAQLGGDLHRGDGGGLLQQGGPQQHKAREGHIGGHGPAQLPKAQGVPGVQVQVLGVAHGGEHAPQVGGQGLQHHQGDHQPLLPRQPQHHQAKGHKGDEGHVVGDDHAEEKGQGHQHQQHGSGGAGAAQQPAAQKLEDPRSLKSLDHRHQAEEQGQGVPVHVAQIPGPGGHEAGGHRRQHQGDPQHRLSFEKPCHGPQGRLGFRLPHSHPSRTHSRLS